MFILGAIAGAVAESAYGLPDWIRQNVRLCLKAPLKRVAQEFTDRFMTAG